MSGKLFLFKKVWYNYFMITEKDLDMIEERMSDTFATKEDLTAMKSDLLNVLDEILKEVSDNRDERTIMGEHVSRNTRRIEKIEKKLGLQMQNA
jgi:hypothetical protein